MNSISDLLPSGGVNVISTHLYIYNFFIPKAFIKEVDIPKTRNTVVDEEHVLTYVEFLFWIFLWFIMENIEGFQHRGFWRNIPIDPLETAPNYFNDTFVDPLRTVGFHVLTNG